MGKFRIKRYEKTVTIADGQTVGTATADNLNGVLKGVLVDCPDLTGTTTLTVDILDSDGFTVFTKATIAENVKTALQIDANNQPFSVALSGAYTLKATASNSQTGAKNVNLVLLIDRGA